MKCDQVGLKKKVPIALDRCHNENCNLNRITVIGGCVRLTLVDFWVIVKNFGAEISLSESLKGHCLVKDYCGHEMLQAHHVKFVG